MLITPCADINQTSEYVRVETYRSLLWTADDEHIYNRLLDTIKNQYNITIKFLLCLYLQFPDVKYSNSRYQIIRQEIESNELARMFADNFNYNAK